MSNEHTPTPWRADITAHRTIDGTSCVAFIVSEKTNIADVCNSYNISTEEAVANAAFIVRACNSHAALVAALEGFDNFAWTAVTADCDESRLYLQQLIDKARAALAAVESQPAVIAKAEGL